MKGKINRARQITEKAKQLFIFIFCEVKFCKNKKDYICLATFINRKEGK